MFTGIVEERGRVRRLERAGRGARLEIACETVTDDAARGSSVAVDGCCLTVVELPAGGFVTELTAETLRATCLGDHSVGHEVNLERPVAVGGRLGGHLVQGHVDGVGEVLEVDREPAGSLLRVGVPAGLEAYLVTKGSVAVQGASLTVAGVGPEWFSVWLIPHTQQVTTLGALTAGDRVNLEVDVVAKYVRRLLAADAAGPYAPEQAPEPSPSTSER